MLAIGAMGEGRPLDGERRSRSALRAHPERSRRGAESEIELGRDGEAVVPVVGAVLDQRRQAPRQEPAAAQTRALGVSVREIEADQGVPGAATQQIVEAVFGLAPGAAINRGWTPASRAPRDPDLVCGLLRRPRA